jgi:sulfotransferase family protein
MRVRTLVPKPLQPAARRIYLQVGPATSALRMEPSFMVIGGQRCGTTSIFKGLAEHPQVVRPPVEKGTDYFTLNYGRDRGWYRGHFPIAAVAGLRTRRQGPPVAFEACTYYLFHPFALERISHDYPDIKLVAMLRDPVQRAFSAYKHEYARGFETEDDFERALDLEDERLEGEIAKMRADVGYESIPHRHHAYQRRGQYAEQLQRGYQLFPAEQIYVMESEAFFRHPAQQYSALLEFLGLRPYLPPAFDQHNARPSSPMPARAQARLERHYAPHDEALTALLGRPPSWLL